MTDPTPPPDGKAPDAPRPDEPAAPPARSAGHDLARSALEDARAAARAAGKSVGRGNASPQRARTSGSRRRWSGPGPDQRDPQPFGSLAKSIARRQGWSSALAEGAIFGNWAAVVGEDIAAHATPTSLSEKVLHVSAESTSWATQLRLLQPKILAKIRVAVGDGVVTSLRITGPTAPSWRKGPRHVRGRGPRDTYG